MTGSGMKERIDRQFKVPFIRSNKIKSFTRELQQLMLDIETLHQQSSETEALNAFYYLIEKEMDFYQQVEPVGGSYSASIAETITRLAGLYRKSCLPVKDKKVCISRSFEIFWGERFLEHLSKKEMGGVRKILADIYEERGEFAKAFELCLANFKSKPSVSLYRQLQFLAGENNSWVLARRQLLENLRATCKFEVLSDILIHEQEFEEVIKAALELPVPETCLWTSAQTVEAEFPFHSLKIYERLVERYIRRKNKTDYRYAIEALKRVKELYGKLSKEDAWQRYLHQLVVQNSEKKLLLEMLKDTTAGSILEVAPVGQNSFLSSS